MRIPVSEYHAPTSTTRRGEDVDTPPVPATEEAFIEIAFDPETDLIFHYDKVLPRHANGVVYTLTSVDNGFETEEYENNLAIENFLEGEASEELGGVPLVADAPLRWRRAADPDKYRRREFYSVGGGFILDEEAIRASGSTDTTEAAFDANEINSVWEKKNLPKTITNTPVDEASEPSPAVTVHTVPYPFDTFEQLRDICLSVRLTIPDVILANEIAAFRERDNLTKEFTDAGAEAHAKRKLRKLRSFTDTEVARKV